MKTKTRILSMLLAIVMLFGVMAGVDISAFAATSGDYEYELLSNGTAVITGYNGNAAKLTIPSKIAGKTITSIGDWAFAYCTDLTSVTIPNSVTLIDIAAFRGCTGLTSITIPNSVTSIGNGAFSDCTGLTSVTIPNRITSIANGTFWGCTGLTSVTIPGSVASIGELAFSDCTSLTSITIPNSVTSIEYEAFQYCTGLTGVTIPNSVTSIGDYAFQYCTDLTSITLPNSITSIGSYAFYDTGYYNNENNWSNGVLYIGNHLIKAKDDIVKGKYTIKSGTVTIADSAFSDCTGLTSITIPNSVTSIKYCAFYKCSGLTSITIPNSITEIESSAFERCTGLIDITIPSSVTSIGSSAFEGCTGLTNITLPNNVTSIESCAFKGCTGLTGIAIPSSVTSIKDAAFARCKNLINVTIPNSVTSIGDYAFSCCTELSSITIPGSVTSIGDNAFEVCSGLKSITIYNKNCTLDYSGILEETTIYGYPNSTAQTYAKENGNKFVALDAPEAPTAKYAVNADRTFTISWNEAAGADKYEIYSYNASSGTYKYVKTTTDLSYTTGKAAFGTTYKYKIRAVNSANNVKSGYCTVSAVNNQYLPAPTAKYAVNSDRTFTVSWNKVTGADKYEIYSYNASSGTYKYVKTTTALSYTTGKATFGTTYKYKIRAVNSEKNIKSGYCTVSAVNNQYLPAPSAKYAVNSDCTLTVSWAKVTGADKYEIYSYNASTGTYKYVKTTTDLSYKTGRASYGVTYKYKIRAVNSANTIKSGYCTVTAVNNKKLTTPTAKLAVNTNGSFTISWGKVTGATKYEVYIYDSAKQQYRLSRTTTGTSITTGTASKGVSYKYKVRAITSKDASATSDFSAVVTGKR